MHKAQETLCYADVFPDLLFKRFRAGEFDFVAEPLEESKFDFGFGLEIDGVEVENVGFDGEGIGPERGTNADIGHRVEGFVVDCELGDVNTDLWNQFVVAA